MWIVAESEPVHGRREDGSSAREGLLAPLCSSQAGRPQSHGYAMTVTAYYSSNKSMHLLYSLLGGIRPYVFLWILPGLGSRSLEGSIPSRLRNLYSCSMLPPLDYPCRYAFPSIRIHKLSFCRSRKAPESQAFTSSTFTSAAAVNS